MGIAGCGGVSPSLCLAETPGQVDEWESVTAEKSGQKYPDGGHEHGETEGRN